MGNRGWIVSKDSISALYLHWNGGRDSVEAFLEYAKLKRLPSPNNDAYFGLVTVIANFFGNDGFNIYPESAEAALDTDERTLADNGTYLIDGWDIVGRITHRDCMEQSEHDLNEMLVAIDEAQPAREQLGVAYLTAEEIPVSDVKLGDMVYVSKYKERPVLREVIGFGTDQMVNGQNRLGVPYVNLYDGLSDLALNPNNYLRGETVRVKTL